ncbi:MAG: hypothetical protein ACD_39C01487G0001, partial [uncultured bacterium]
AWTRAVWLDPALRYELIRAFDLDDDAREELLGCLTYDNMAKAA